ncbi:MAG: FAD-binding oxidoreductase [Verrucomicrobiota bacterium]
MDLIHSLSDICLCYLPDSNAYVRLKSQLESAEAFLSRPPIIACPKTVEQVASLVDWANWEGYALTVKGGGHSRMCAHDQAIMVDLSGFRRAEWDGSFVVAGGGALMGDVLKACPTGMAVPIGAAQTPGMGLALQGGIGALTRSCGLTIDHLAEVTIVAGSGELRIINEYSWGSASDLWWALRGAGSQFGIITEARFRTSKIPRTMRYQQLKLNLESLIAYGEYAPKLPREVSLSGVIGRGTTDKEHSLLLQATYATDDAEVHETADTIIDELVAQPGSEVRWELDTDGIYLNAPLFDMPNDDGSYAIPWQPGDQAHTRLRTYKKTLFVKSLDDAHAKQLIEFSQKAPTPYCRIDFQQTGGALRDVAQEDSAFWNRDFEWSVTVCGGWLWGTDQEDACVEWVRDVRNSLHDTTAGQYSVEIFGEDGDFDKELAASFGDHLPRLKQIKARWDPQQVFRHYLQLES